GEGVEGGGEWGGAGAPWARGRAGGVDEPPLHGAAGEQLQGHRRRVAGRQREGVEVRRHGRVGPAEHRQPRRGPAQADGAGVEVLRRRRRVVAHAGEVRLVLQRRVERGLHRVTAHRGGGAAHDDRVDAAGGGQHRLQQGLLPRGGGRGRAEDGVGRVAQLDGRLQGGTRRGDQHRDRLARVDVQGETVRVARRADRGGDARVINQRTQGVLGRQRRRVGDGANVHGVAGTEGGGVRIAKDVRQLAGADADLEGRFRPDAA